MRSSGPIIVLGTGRSGTTIAHRMLSDHPHVAWLSRVCNGFPRTAPLHRALMRSLDIAAAEPLLRRLLHPDECYPFWDGLYPGFSESCRDLHAGDVTCRVERRIRSATAALTTKGRSRPLFKITGWPRVAFLHRVYPDATFVHVLRDGRAVANSLLAVDFWRGWRGPENWRWGPLTPEHQAEWERHDRSFVVLAAIQWKILVDAIEAACADIDPARVHVLRCEDLCRDPVGSMRAVAAACDLEWTPGFEARVRRRVLRDSGGRYRSELTEVQQAELEEVLADHLERFGYR